MSSAILRDRAVIDMPDRRARDLVRLVLQNDGRLSARTRPRFPERTDAEIAACERAVRDARDAARHDDLAG